MAVDMFMKIDTVDGEAQDTKHKKEIDVLSWSWGMSNAGSAHAGGGAGAGKVNVQDLTFTKWVDNADAEACTRMLLRQTFQRRDTGGS
jgi:type VI secretion system secreted protein Hcp